MRAIPASEGFVDGGRKLRIGMVPCRSEQAAGPRPVMVASALYQLDADRYPCAYRRGANSAPGCRVHLAPHFGCPLKVTSRDPDRAPRPTARLVEHELGAA